LHLVPERKPFFVDEDEEPVERSEIRVEEQLHEGAHLGGTVPTVAAMDHHRGPPLKECRHAR
jgi:hypothetical protein